MMNFSEFHSSSVTKKRTNDLFSDSLRSIRISSTLTNNHIPCLTMRVLKSKAIDGSATSLVLSNSKVASQSLRVRRPISTIPPLHLPNQGINTPRKILEETAWHKGTEVAQMREENPVSVTKTIGKAPPSRDFIAALNESRGRPAVIPEVNNASPRRNGVFDPVEIAIGYERGGAACVSVLLEDRYFEGAYENLEAIRNAGVMCPLLCKDLIIDAWQIYYARAKGADAVLLMAAVLQDPEIKYMTKVCKSVGLTAMLEVRDENEMDRMLEIEGIELVSINNRNLETSEVDIRNIERLLEGERGEKIRQKDITVVAEFGLFTAADVAYVQEAGVKAIFVGETKDFALPA